MGQFNRREVVCVFGANGQGKTRWVQKHLSHWTRAVIVEGGFQGEQEFLGVKAGSYREFEGYMESHLDSLFRVRYVPTAQEFPLVCDWVRLAGSCTFVVDEADRFLTNRVMEPEFLELCNRGRHFGEHEGVSIVAVSANPFDFPIAFRRQITKAIIFNTAEPNDVDWLAKLIGREMADKAALLQHGHFFQWDRGHGITLKTLEVLDEE